MREDSFASARTHEEEETIGFLLPLLRRLTQLILAPSRRFLSEPKGKRRNDPKHYGPHAVRLEAYICGWALVEFLIFWAFSTGRLSNWANPDFYWAGKLFLLAVIWRIAEIIASAFWQSVLRRMIGPFHRKPANRERIVVLGLINYFELALCFACVYSANSANLVSTTPGVQLGPWDPLYFSIMTALAVGYGDVVPKDSLRFVAGLQGLLSFFLVIVFIARFINLLGVIPGHQESKLEE